jgi:Cell division septal protein
MREVENAGRSPARRKRKRKRRLSRLAYILILLVIALIAAAVCAAVFFKVEKVAVEGASPYSDAQIAGASGIKKGTNLFSIKQDPIEKNLCSKLPFIKSAAIKLNIPTTVTIDVIQDTPKYLFIIGKRYVYADDKLKALELRADPRSGKGVINVTGAQIAAVQAGTAIAFKTGSQASLIQTLAAEIAAAGLPDATSMNVADSYQLSVLYDNRINILIGTPNGADDKLRAAGQIISQALKPDERGTLDVSAQNKRYIFSPD